VGQLEAIGRELLPAIAYGDAAGLPVETRNAAYIAARYGRINCLLPSTENPFYQGEFAPGTWSDDTQLSLVVAQSLMRVGAFELRDIANLHVKAYAQTPQVVRGGQAVKRGWGGSTTRSVERYMQGMAAEHCGESGGMGNGVIMKLGPLAYWHIARGTAESSVYRDCDALTAFTHAHPTARVATRVHYDVLHHLATEEYAQEAFVRTTQESALRHERLVGDTSRDVSSELRYLSGHFFFDTDTILRNTDGMGFIVPQTLAMAYGAFLAHEGEFASSIYEAVNLGGDTDSTASIVAVMATMKSRGKFKMPPDYRATLDHDMLLRQSAALAHRALKG
jgi:ADP-ribosyl-[dinitrogen reductase] hydrolase